MLASRSSRFFCWILSSTRLFGDGKLGGELCGCGDSEGTVGEHNISTKHFDCRSCDGTTGIVGKAVSTLSAIFVNSGISTPFVIGFKIGDVSFGLMHALVTDVVGVDVTSAGIGVLIILQLLLSDADSGDAHIDVASDG